MRRVLFDENMPRKLRREFPEFAIRTAQEQGWSAYQNGELLKRAAAEFEVLITIDQRMRYQQNLSQLKIAIVVLDVRDTRLVHLMTLVEQLRSVIATVAIGDIAVVLGPP